MSNALTDAVPFLSREEIEGRARQLRREHGLETVPTDLLELTDRLGIKVNNARFSEDRLVGLVVKRGGDVTILVREEDPPFRKRFTIAHELGHSVLHLPGDGELMDQEINLYRTQWTEPDSSPEQRREIQANLFAAALMMPEEDVRTLWERLGSVERMARLFEVSPSSMGIRISQLGLA